MEPANLIRYKKKRYHNKNKYRSIKYDFSQERIQRIIPSIHS